MNVKVLVTCGATWTPIDDIRVISNISTGEMGHEIAQAFRKAGAGVTVIEGAVTHVLAADSGIKIVKYRFFDELAKALRIELLKKYDIIIHAAAVSDFKAVSVSKNKISSDKVLTLKLVPTPKLIKDIKRLSPKSILVGFKLESNIRRDAINGVFETTKSLFESSGCDLVVANTLKGGYKGYIVNADGEILSKARNKNAIAKELVKLLKRAR
jgi:phosphopantothenoylcysteine decarboxylase/phosphopantothenate--cysteine ligase